MLKRAIPGPTLPVIQEHEGVSSGGVGELKTNNLLNNGVIKGVYLAMYCER